MGNRSVSLQRGAKSLQYRSNEGHRGMMLETRETLQCCSRVLQNSISKHDGNAVEEVCTTSSRRALGRPSTQVGGYLRFDQRQSTLRIPLSLELSFG